MNIWISWPRDRSAGFYQAALLRSFMLSSFARLNNFLIRDLELWFPIRAVLCQITRFVCFCFLAILAGMRLRFCVRWFVLVQPLIKCWLRSWSCGLKRMRNRLFGSVRTSMNTDWPLRWATKQDSSCDLNLIFARVRKPLCSQRLVKFLARLCWFCQLILPGAYIAASYGPMKQCFPVNAFAVTCRSWGAMMNNMYPFDGITFGA